MKKILICKYPWQTRIAITVDGLLQNIYQESHTIEPLERTFFKGVITKILPGIQTAFVDIGQKKAGFLHISEIDREMASTKNSKDFDDDEEKKPQIKKSSLDISKIFKEGESVLVQVNKEPIYEKGAKLTTCYTLPGRFIVLMPNISRISISKKIDNKEDRAALRELIRKYLPENMGAIIRTTAKSQKTKAIINDINYLVKTWKNIEEKFKQAEPKEKIHEDIPLSLQVVRDHLDDDVENIITNDKENQKIIYNFIKNFSPEYSHIIKLQKEPPKIFETYNIEKQVESALNKKVNLKSGGSLIIETTEAMTVIDVNTGKFIGKKKMADTILTTNLEAAEEIVRQLRLRNIGGLIVIDFIDMVTAADRQQLIHFFEKTLKKRDKFQSVVLKVSEFGLVQMTRKRSGKTLLQQIMIDCPTCSGCGFIKSLKTQCYQVMSAIKHDLDTKSWPKDITIKINSKLFNYITHTEFNAILYYQNLCNVNIILASDDKLSNDQYKIEKK